jgi:hypothetical protein
MKLRYVAPLAIAASAAAIGLAPIAAADATVHQSQGNAQITATPGAAAERPSIYGKARLQDGQFLCQDPKCPKYRSHGALAVGLAG